MNARTRFAALLTVALLAAPAAAHDHDALGQAISGAHRAEADRARDTARHPRETLEFFGFEPSQRVIEVYPGGGWYTDILAPAVRGHGRLVAAHFPSDTQSAYQQRVRGEFLAKLGAAPEIYDQVEVIGYVPGAEHALGAPGSADLVLTFRNLHSFYGGGNLEKFFADAFAVLKSGGTLGVVQHRAPAGTDPETGKEAGYLPEAWVVEQAQAAGFELAERSEVNANPKDTADHPGGVWALPPTLRQGDADRDKYLAIGESDRMTLRFVKP
jgi:predicted methyltransferase